jgi:hypothetical protein
MTKTHRKTITALKNGYYHVILEYQNRLGDWSTLSEGCVAKFPLHSIPEPDHYLIRVRVKE